ASWQSRCDLRPMSCSQTRMVLALIDNGAKAVPRLLPAGPRKLHLTLRPDRDLQRRDDFPDIRRSTAKRQYEALADSLLVALVVHGESRKHRQRATHGFVEAGAADLQASRLQGLVQKPPEAGGSKELPERSAFLQHEIPQRTALLDDL